MKAFVKAAGAWATRLQLRDGLMGSRNNQRGKGIADVCRRLTAGDEGGSTQLPAGRWPLIRRGGALLQGESHGNAIIEIALVLPVLMTLVTGVFAFGIAFANELTLTSAVGAGGQYLQVIRNDSAITDPCAATLTAIENAAPSLTPGNIKLAVTMNGVSYPASGTPAANLSCSAGQSNLVANTPVTVTATYPCALPIYGARFTAGCQLSAKVTEYEY